MSCGFSVAKTSMSTFAPPALLLYESCTAGVSLHQTKLFERNNTTSPVEIELLGNSQIVGFRHNTRSFTKTEYKNKLLLEQLAV